jgi:hypothetical protein
MDSNQSPHSDGSNIKYSSHYHHLTIGKIARVFGWAISGIVIACFLALIFGLLVKWLWAVTLTPLFNLPQLTYWQAVGLIILAKLIFGGIGHNKDNTRFARHKKWHDRFNGHYDNQRSPFNRFLFGAAHGKYYKEFWEKEGKQAFADYLERRGTTISEE